MPDARAPFRAGAVVLAAGASSRMGSPKQILELGGVPLVALALRAVLSSSAATIVLVVGAHANLVRQAVAGMPVLVVDNPAWRDGMATSIRVGIRALEATSPGLDAVLVAPCDQPGLTAAVVESLLFLHQSTGKIAAARYGGRNGAPAVFGREHFGMLMDLSGDEGARALLNRGPEAVASLDQPELMLDLDTPADVAAWVSRRS